MVIPSFISKDYKINKTSVSSGKVEDPQWKHVCAPNKYEPFLLAISTTVCCNSVLLPLKSLTALLRHRTLTSGWNGPRFVQDLQCWEAEIFHQISLRALQCLLMTLLMTPSYIQEGKSIFLQLDGEEPDMLSCWSTEKLGFVSSDGLAEHTRKYRRGWGHSKLDLALQCARIS